MALEIEKPDQPLGLVADRPLKLAADNYTLVEADDPDGRYNLVGSAGAMIPAEHVHRLHLTAEGGKVQQMARDKAYRASGQEPPDLEEEEPKAQWLVRPTAPPPPPPPEGGDLSSSATPQSPPTAPAAVPADQAGDPAAHQTIEEKVRLADRARRMSSGDVTTPVPDEGAPLRKTPSPKKTETAEGAPERVSTKRGAKKATKRGRK